MPFVWAIAGSAVTLIVVGVVYTFFIANDSSEVTTVSQSETSTVEETNDQSPSNSVAERKSQEASASSSESTKTMPTDHAVANGSSEVRTVSQSETSIVEETNDQSPSNSVAERKSEEGVDSPSESTTDLPGDHENESDVADETHDDLYVTPETIKAISKRLGSPKISRPTIAFADSEDEEYRKIVEHVFEHQSFRITVYVKKEGDKSFRADFENLDGSNLKDEQIDLIHSAHTIDNARWQKSNINGKIGWGFRTRIDGKVVFRTSLLFKKGKALMLIPLD